MKSMAALFVLSGALVAGELSIENVRMVTSRYGPRKTDATIVPGENLVILLDAVGAAQEDGKLRFVLSFTVTNAAGETIADIPGQETHAADSFRRGPLRVIVTVNFPGETPLGKYAVKIVVEDKIAKARAEVMQEVEVVEPTLGTINQRLSMAPDGEEEHGPFVADGENLCLVFGIVGLGLKDGNARVEVDIRILDESGKEISALPNILEGEAPPQNGQVKGHIGICFTGNGKFTLKVTVRDLHAGRSTDFEYPVEIDSMNR